MTTLVHTCPEGPSNQQIDLLTPTTQKRSRVLTLDSTLVDNVSSVPGATVTDALNSLARAALVQVLGWAPGANQPLELLPAGHAPGLYTVAWSVVVRTTGIGTSMSGVLSFDDPSGSFSRTLFSAGSWTNLGTIIQNTGTQTGTGRQATIMSLGTAPITITFAGGGSAGIADLFGAAIRIA